MSLPTLKVELDDDGLLNGARLDDDRTAKLNTAVLEYTAPAFASDITDFVRGLSTQRGAQRELQRVEAGTATLVLDNRDGRFTPFKVSSPYYPNVLPMRRIRINAQFGISLPTTNLAAWYDFGDITQLWQDTARTTPIIADGQIIKGVTDKSGNGNHLSEATNGPTYKTGIINGNSIARFDGANDTLTKTPFASGTLTQPYTAFMVGKTPDTSEVNAPWTDGADGTSRGHIVMTEGGAGNHWNFFAGTTVINSSVVANTNVHVFCVVMNAASSSFRVDGGADTDGGGNPGTSTLTGITLANNVPAGGSTFAQVDLMHVVLYSGDLANSVKDQVGQALASDAGTTWTAVS